MKSADRRRSAPRCHCRRVAALGAPRARGRRVQPGLNLFCDRYRLDYGPAGATGPIDAPVQIRSEIVSGSPPIASMLPSISARVGLDRAPVDLHDPDQSRWQLACSWPDTGRLERTRLALDEARRGSLNVVRGDAVGAVGAVLETLPPDATAVVMTTWVVAYFSPEQRAGFRDALAAASAIAACGVDQRGDSRSRRPDPERGHPVRSGRNGMERARPRHLPERRRGTRAARARASPRKPARLATSLRSGPVKRGARAGSVRVPHVDVARALVVTGPGQADDRQPEWADPPEARRRRRLGNVDAELDEVSPDGHVLGRDQPFVEVERGRGSPCRGTSQLSLITYRPAVSGSSTYAAGSDQRMALAPATEAGWNPTPRVSSSCPGSHWPESPRARGSEAGGSPRRARGCEPTFAGTGCAPPSRSPRRSARSAPFRGLGCGSGGPPAARLET